VPGWYTQPRASLETPGRWVSVGTGSTLEDARERALAGFAQRLRAQVRVRDRSRLSGDMAGQEAAFVRDVHVDSDVLIRGARVEDVWRSVGGDEVAVLMVLNLGVMETALRETLRASMVLIGELLDEVAGQGMSPLERVQRLVRAQGEVMRAWEQVYLLGGIDREVESDGLRSRQTKVVELLGEAWSVLRVHIRVADGEVGKASEAFEEVAGRRFRVALPTDRVHALLTFESSVRRVPSEPHPSGVWSSIMRWEMRVRMVDVVTGERGAVWRREGVSFGSSEAAVRRDAQEQMEAVVRDEFERGLTRMLGGYAGGGATP
jgi:hypothetical protein